jgi:hypothetical protein
VPSGASPDADLHQHLEDITMRDEFPDHDPDTPTENDLDLAYGSKYLGVTDLGSRRIRTPIQKVRKEELTDKDGRRRWKFIIYFDALDKPLVLNTTNKDELVRELGRVPKLDQRSRWIVRGSQHHVRRQEDRRRPAEGARTGQGQKPVRYGTEAEAGCRVARGSR